MSLLWKPRYIKCPALRNPVQYFQTLSDMKKVKVSDSSNKTKLLEKEGTNSRVQLLEGRLVLNPGLNLTRVSFSFVQKHFLGQFSLIFIEHRIINLLTKRIKLNLLYKLSYLNSNFALTLGYLNPALNFDNGRDHLYVSVLGRYLSYRGVP